MGNNQSKSLQLAKKFLGKKIEVIMDRPIGSKHPQYDFVYESNYGYIEGIKAPDGKDLDAYYLGTDKLVEKAVGIVKAIVHRLDDDDDKLIVMPEDIEMSNEEIEKCIFFQEKWFKHKIIKE